MTYATTMRTQRSTPGPIVRAHRHHTTGRTAGLLAIAWIVAGVAGCGGTSTAAAPSTASESSEEDPLAGQTETLDLGETTLRQTRMLENSTINVRFNAHVVASEKNAERLSKILAASRHQAREEVIFAVRTAETWEFDETELTRLRRRIQFRLNRWLDAPLVEDIILTDFRFRVD